MDFREVNSAHADFKALTRSLDMELVKRYGAKQEDYNRHNEMAVEDPAIVGYVNGTPAACGSFRRVSESAVEIKRMYVADEHRRKGYSTNLLGMLEALACKHGYRTALLETGKGQPEDLGLYRKADYEVIDNYPPYENMENSICMKKKL